MTKQQQDHALPATLPQLLRRAAASYPATNAIVDGELAITYSDLVRRAEEAARSLIALGVQAGARVAIWAPNLHEWIVAACAIHCAGAIMVPLNTRMKGAEAADILERSQAEVLFFIGDFLGQYYPALLDGLRPATLRQVVVLRDGAPRSAHAEVRWDAFLALAAQTPAARVAEREAGLGADSTSDLMFTSGTTGRPKGVLAAHGAMIRAFDEWSRVNGLAHGDRYLIINPFFHTFGYKAGWVSAFIRGATVYPEQVFDAEAVMRRIARDRRLSRGTKA